jgi:DNA-binding transcriptional ArsR family regulator
MPVAEYSLRDGDIRGPRRGEPPSHLAQEERPVGDLVTLLALSQPAVSKHLKVLREAGLVESRTDAQRPIYRVRPEPLREVDEWLAPYRRQWADHLSALERHLQIMDGSEGEAWT